MKNNRKRCLVTWMSVLCFISLIYIGTILGKKIKFDFTEDELFTLSKGTVEILQSLTSPIKIRLYYSKKAAQKGAGKIRAFHHYSSYVKKFLSEYVAYSNGKLSLEVIDPRPNTKHEEDALGYGLENFHLTETERYFFGLVMMNSNGVEKIIEFFNPQDQANLEYKLTRYIYLSNNPQRKKIGVISSLNLINLQTDPYLAQLTRMQGKAFKKSWELIDLFREFYEVQKIETKTRKISGIDVLVIIHPKKLPKETLWAIDQFVLNGGRVLLLVDPYAVVDQSKLVAQNEVPRNSSNLKVLMDQWGVEMLAGELAGDKELAGVGQLNPQRPPQRLLSLVVCDERCTKHYREPVSVHLDQMNLILPGSLRKRKLANIKFFPILATTERGNTYRARANELGDPTLLWRRFREGEKAVVMGAKIIGKFKSAFPEGMHLESSGDETSRGVKEHLIGLKESLRESAIIVFSDVDFIHDQFAFKQGPLSLEKLNNNSDLLLNSLESLTSETSLMSIQSKGRYDRGFDVIDQIERKASVKPMKKMDQLQISIEKNERELRDLSRLMKRNDMLLDQKENIRKRRALGQKLASLKAEYREFKHAGREKVEMIRKLLLCLNTLLMPTLVLTLGLFVYRRRKES